MYALDREAAWSRLDLLYVPTAITVISCGPAKWALDERRFTPPNKSK